MVYDHTKGQYEMTKYYDTKYRKTTFHRRIPFLTAKSWRIVIRTNLAESFLILNSIDHFLSPNSFLTVFADFCGLDFSLIYHILFYNSVSFDSVNA